MGRRHRRLGTATLARRRPLAMAGRGGGVIVGTDRRRAGASRSGAGSARGRGAPGKRSCPPRHCGARAARPSRAPRRPREEALTRR